MKAIKLYLLEILVKLVVGTVVVFLEPQEAFGLKIQEKK